MTSAPRILVIEDSETLRDLVRQILQIESYEVRTAIDGEEGLRLAREATPDLVLCDVAMPRMNGHDVLRALRADAATAAVPFIFLTAKAERSDLRLGMELGADDYLTKPFDAEELLAAVRSRLRKHETIRTAAQQVTDRQSDLLLNLPHEVRTPLAGILGLAELLIEADFSPEDRRRMVNDILASGRRLERTLTNLVLHLELELARQSPQRARGFIGRERTAVVHALRAAATAKGNEYKRSVPVAVSPDTLMVAMEEAFLQKIVEELLDNALRFSPPGSPVQVTARQDGAKIVIEVSDTGIGMTPEQIEGLQAFRQFDRLKRNREGLGVGIAIAQHLVELNRGEIAFAARPEAGLLATVRLPVEG